MVTYQFKPGDVVRFKPEHQGYRDRTFCVEPMTVKYVPGKYIEWVDATGRTRSCYKYRVELDEGPW